MRKRIESDLRMNWRLNYGVKRIWKAILFLPEILRFWRCWEDMIAKGEEDCITLQPGETISLGFP